MELCIIRHAIAEELSSRYPSDWERPLTDEGRRKMQDGARGLMTAWQPEAILTSPVLRAVQTAQILSEVTGAPIVAEVDGLANGNHRQVVEAVAATGHERVATVGHEPLCGAFLSFLLTGDADRVSVQFKKGAAALVGFRDGAVAGGGWLEWLAQPSMLRQLAGSNSS